MIALPDVNVLIARSDAGHQFHRRVRDWLREQAAMALATCAITENGFLRVYGHPNYPDGPGSPGDAARDLGVLRDRPGHRFLPEDFSILSTEIDLGASAPSQLTDLYLLGLAVKNGGRLATFDAGIDASLLPNGPSAYLIIPSP